MTRPFSCVTCGTKPRARRGNRYCYDCMPGGPIVPPPCQRCGSVGDYYASGLCVRCHWFAPQRVDSCSDCYAWGATRTNKWLCKACVGWRANHDTITSCVVCGRTLTINRRGICRLCYTGARLRRHDKQASDPVGANRHGTGLFLADMHKKRTRKRPDPLPPVPGWPADRPLPHRQLVLFAMPYDLTRGRGVVGPPRDPVLAEALDQHTIAYAAEAGWDPVLTSKVRCGIRLLLGMQDTPGAAIGQIKGRVGQGQKGRILVAPLGDHQRRRGAADAACETCIKAHMALRIGDRRPQHRVGARKQRHLDPRQRARAGKTAGKNMQAVIAHQRRQAQIGQHEPLGRAGLVILIDAFDCGGQGVDARRLVGQNLAQRQAGGHGLI